MIASFSRRVLASLLLASLALVSLSEATSAATTVTTPGPSITFGRYGGNIRPLTVTLVAPGTIIALNTPQAGSNSVRAVDDSQNMIIGNSTMDGLLTLARAEGFYHMPAQLVGRGLPDIGGRYITITSSGQSKTVRVRYMQNAAFDQLYSVLMAVSGNGRMG